MIVHTFNGSFRDASNAGKKKPSNTNKYIYF